MQSDKVTSIPIVSIPRAELYHVNMGNKEEKFIDQGVLQIVHIQEMECFLVVLNQFKYGLNTSLPVHASSSPDNGLRSYVFPSTNGYYIFRIKDVPDKVILQSFEVILAKHSQFTDDGSPLPESKAEKTKTEQAADMVKSGLAKGASMFSKGFSKGSDYLKNKFSKKKNEGETVKGDPDAAKQQQEQQQQQQYQQQQQQQQQQIQYAPPMDQAPPQENKKKEVTEAQAMTKATLLALKAAGKQDPNSLQTPEAKMKIAKEVAGQMDYQEMKQVGKAAWKLGGGTMKGMFSTLSTLNKATGTDQNSQKAKLDLLTQVISGGSKNSNSSSGAQK